MPPEFDEAFRLKLEELMIWRRDVRRFRTDPVPDDTLNAILHAFDLAPSVGNSQPWRLVRIESEVARAVVRQSFERCNGAALEASDPSRAELYVRLKLAGLTDAPVQFAVFCDAQTEQGHGLGRATMPETMAYSTAGAVTLFALAARAYGIGVGWVSILEPDVVAQALDVPKDWALVSYLCIGFPEDEDDVPELERAGWQARQPDRTILTR